MRSTLAVSLAVPLVAMALAGCAPSAGPDGAEGTALPSHGNAQLTREEPTGRIMNFAFMLNNQDGSSFRVRSVRLISR